MASEYNEVDWIEMKSDESDEDNGFNGMFNDPDPFDTFVHTFCLDPSDCSGASAAVAAGPSSDATTATAAITITLRGHKAEIGQTLNSTGLTLWRAAPILCHFLVKNKGKYVTDKHLLELGGGLGLCGILAGALKSKCVYITDGDSDSLRGMRENVLLNRGLDGLPLDNVKCRQLRWGLQLEEFGRHVAADLLPDGRFDVIMGSDIIYVESILEPLFATVDSLLTYDKGGAFILAYARRNVKIDLVFSTAERLGFEWAQPEGEEGCFVFSRVKSAALCL